MVRSFIAFAFLFLLLTLHPALAEEAKKEFRDAEYLALVDAAAKDPAKADWAGIRSLYIQSSYYDKVTREGIGGMMMSNLGKKAAETKKPEDIAAYKEHARIHAGSIDTHSEAYAMATKQKADFVNAEAEKAAMKGLGDAIIKTGDGKTLQTAMKVLSTSEQYFIMRSWYNLTPRRKTLENHQGQMYDVHTVVNAKGEEVGEIFFNISLYFGRMEFPAEVQAKFDKQNAEIRAEAQKRAPPPVAPEDQKYLDAIDAARKDPATADWAALRELYANSTFYKRVGGINLAHFTRDMTGYIASRMSPEAIERYQTALRQHYAVAGMQAGAIRLAEVKKADFIDPAAARAALDGIVKAVLATGDGKTPATPYKAISVDETTNVLQTLFATQPEVKMEEHGGQKVMVFRGKAKDGGQDLAAHFILDPRALPQKPAEAPKKP